MEEFNKTDEAQSGFRSGYSIVDNMFTLQSLILKYRSKPGGRFYVLYVDFQKAFDGLIHHKLFTCLHKNGVKGNLFRVLISMYTILNVGYLSALITEKSLNPFTVMLEPDKGT